MQYEVMRLTRDLLVKYLKGFLAHPENYIEFGPRDFSEAYVSDKDPQELRQFPAIVITSGTGHLVTGGFGDFVEEIYNDDNEITGARYGGMFELNYTVEIGCKSTLDRECLSDLILFAYRVLLRRYLQTEGAIVKEINYGGDSETMYDSEKIYISTIQLSIWREWYRDIDYLNYNGINLNLDID